MYLTFDILIYILVIAIQIKQLNVVFKSSWSFKVCIQLYEVYFSNIFIVSYQNKMFFSLNLQIHQFIFCVENIIRSMDFTKGESLYFFQFIKFVEMINFQNPFWGKTNLWEAFWDLILLTSWRQAYFRLNFTK